MKQFFDVDGPIYRFMTTLMNILVLNFCWIIGSIPIVTIGVSTVAAFDVALRMVDDEEGYIVKQYIKAYKENLKQGIPLGLITILAAWAVYLDFQIFDAMENGPLFLLIFGFLSAAIFIACLLYAYPLTARYTNSLLKTMKNSFMITTRFFGWTVLIVAAVVIEGAAFLWNLTMEFIGVLIGPACLILTVSLIAKHVFKKIEKQNAAG